MPPRHHHRHLLRELGGLPASSDACGVDDAQRFALVLEHLIDRIAGGPGDGRDNGPGRAGERIQQGRFADIRAADDGDACLPLLELAVRAVQLRRVFVIVSLEFVAVCDGEVARVEGLGARKLDRCVCLLRKRQHREDLIEQVANVVPMLRRNRNEVRQPQPAKVLSRSAQAFDVHLVDREKDGLPQPPQQLRQVHVGRGEFGPPVDHHDDRRGLVECKPCLRKDLCRNQRVVVGHNAAGVDDARDLPLPLDLAVDAVAGDAGLIADDRAPRAGKPVEQGRLAHIRPPADGNQGHPLSRLGVGQRVWLAYMLLTQGITPDSVQDGKASPALLLL